MKAVICLHRKVALKDHKLVYWIAGTLSGLSVLIEKKARRGELALYVLPRAGDSLWYILVNRHLLPNIKNAEVLAFVCRYVCFVFLFPGYCIELDISNTLDFIRCLIALVFLNNVTTNLVNH